MCQAFCLITVIQCQQKYFISEIEKESAKANPKATEAANRSYNETIDVYLHTKEF